MITGWQSVKIPESGHKKMKLIKVLFFLFFFCLIFATAQNSLLPDWTYPADPDDQISKMQEFQSLPEDTVQVIAAGTSHMQYGFVPMQLYKEKRIRAYNLAVSALRLPATYYQLAEALAYQHPKVIMLDASALFLEGYDGIQWRRVLDTGFRPGLNKLEASVEYASEKNQDTSLIFGGLRDVADAFFPLLFYHERWKEGCSPAGFINASKPYYGKGYVLSTLCQRSWTTVDDLNQMEEELSDTRQFSEIQVVNGSETVTEKGMEPYQVVPSEENRKWLGKIKELCDRSQVELCLVKIPVLIAPRYYASSWTRTKSRLTREIADELGIKYLDVLYEMEDGIDRLRDFRDGGMHMNYHGARKVTNFIGDFLEENYDIIREENGYYDKTAGVHRKIDAAARLQNRDTFAGFCKSLGKQLKGRTLFIAVLGVKDGKLNEEETATLEGLGVRVPAESGIGEDAYLGIVKDGQCIYEAFGKLPVSVDHYAVDQFTEVSAKSVGAANTSLLPPKVSIVVNGAELTQNGRGINIIVYDNETQTVVDRVNFYKNSSDANVTFERNGTVTEKDIKKYEHRLYEGV